MVLSVILFEMIGWYMYFLIIDLYKFIKEIFRYEFLYILLFGFMFRSMWFLCIMFCEFICFLVNFCRGRILLNDYIWILLIENFIFCRSVFCVVVVCVRRAIAFVNNFFVLMFIDCLYDVMMFLICVFRFWMLLDFDVKYLWLFVMVYVVFFMNVALFSFNCVALWVVVMIFLM